MHIPQCACCSHPDSITVSGSLCDTSHKNHQTCTRDHLRVFTLTALEVPLTVSNLWAVMGSEPQENGLGSCDNTGQYIGVENVGMSQFQSFYFET